MHIAAVFRSYFLLWICYETQCNDQNKQNTSAGWAGFEGVEEDESLNHLRDLKYREVLR